MGVFYRAGCVPIAAASVALVACLTGTSLQPTPPTGIGVAPTVHAEAITLTALEAALADPVADSADPGPIAVAITAASVEGTTAPSAAAITVDDVVRTAVAAGIGLAVAPLWYLSFPVSLPVALGFGIAGTWVIDRVFIPSNSEIQRTVNAVLGGSAFGTFVWLAAPALAGMSLANTLIPPAPDPVYGAQAVAAEQPVTEPITAAPQRAVPAASAPTSVQRVSRTATTAAAVGRRSAATQDTTAAVDPTASARGPARGPDTAARRGAAQRDDRTATSRAADHVGRR